MFAAGALDTALSGERLATLPLLNGGSEAATNLAVQSYGRTVIVDHTDIRVQGLSQDPQIRRPTDDRPRRQ
jgi:hypothetical protein